MMYAIYNKKQLKFLYGTDYRYSPPHQRTSYNRLLTYASREEAENDMCVRKCNKNYVVVGIVPHIRWLEEETDGKKVK